MRVLQDTADVYKLATEAHSRLIRLLDPSANEASTTNSETKSSTTSEGRRRGGSHTNLPSMQQTDDIFSELFGEEQHANVTASDFSIKVNATGLPNAEAEEAPWATDSVLPSQNTLDMFSVLMRDDPIDPFNGDFYGWFSDGFS
jgi:hypothetical protein